MERTKSANDGQIRWKNTGNGRLYLRDGRKITGGQIFWAYPHEISVAFRNTIVPLDKDVSLIEKEETYEAVAVKPVYTLQKRGANWFNVVDGNGKVLNEKALKKADALELIKTMEG